MKVLPEDRERAKALMERMNHVPAFLRNDASWLNYVSEGFARAREEIEARIHGHDLHEDEEETRS